jgi:GNAT superfamily N-acetyltransferase
MEVRRVYGAERALAIARLTEEWGAPVLVHGAAYAFDDCEIWMAGEMQGLAAVSGRDRPVAELVAINAFEPRRGVGTALIDAIVAGLAGEFQALRLTTTNDNLDALRFYQRRGFRLHALRPGTVDEARRRKPSIPATGDYGLPIRDEIDLVLDLGERRTGRG